jgi:hypothetical protein
MNLLPRDGTRKYSGTFGAVAMEVGAVTAAVERAAGMGEVA